MIHKCQGKPTCDVLLRQFPDHTGNQVHLLRGKNRDGLLTIHISNFDRPYYSIDRRIRQPVFF